MRSGPGGGTFPGRIAFLSEERAMYYVIGANGSQYGPVDEATIRAWIAEGRIASPSLSFKTGESGWVPLQTREEFRDLLAAAPASPVVAPPHRRNPEPQRLTGKRPLTS